MGRIYTATFDNVAVTAAHDFFEVVAPSDAPVLIHGWELGQTTEAGDAQDELLRLALVLGHATSGSGGSSFTPLPLDSGDAAFGGSCEINNTTIASTGTARVMHATCFNVRQGHIWLPTPELRVKLVAGVRAVLRLLAAPADSVTFSGTIYFEELG